jgi:hypothetical protein
MFESNDSFEKLAERTMDGDAAAGVELRRQLEPQMCYMVRYALTPERVATPLSRSIARAAHAMEPALAYRQTGVNDRTIKRLAARLSQRFVDHIRARGVRHDARETIQQAFCTLVA